MTTDRNAPKGRRLALLFLRFVVLVATTLRWGSLYAVEVDSNGKGCAASQASCKEAGPFLCGGQRVADIGTGGCPLLRGCFEGQKIEKEFVETLQACDDPIYLDGGSGARKYAVLAADVLIDGPPSHAVFLFSGEGDGWYLADVLMGPIWTHGGYCKVDVRLEFDGPRDVVVAQRTCAMPLDRDEIVAGESNVAVIECAKSYYDISSGPRKKRLSQVRFEGNCVSVR